jgi:hypothetical protein
VPWADLGFSRAEDVSINAGFLALDDTTSPNAPFVSDAVSSLQVAAVPEPGGIEGIVLCTGISVLVAYRGHRRRGSPSR